ncbi:zinc finger BED domain-containing protein RICESLEEPER 2-like [Silene latifolia]|uniref:zinc finger BED domain-containing protein RICESLEEPER 2-like n=1 Tax=Silene latifolia TaxID=37657 RepID=UPI003D77CD7D
MASSQPRRSGKRRCVISEQHESEAPPTVDLLDEEESEEMNETVTQKSYIPHPTKKSRPGRRYLLKTSRLRAPYWVDYELFLDDADHVRAECQHCDSTFAADTVINGTKNLKKHSSTCEKNPNNLSKGKQAQLVLEPIDGQEGEARLKNRIVSHDDIRDSIAYMLVLDELAFRHVDKPGFKYFMSVVCPTFHIPSRWTIASDCFKLYLRKKDILKDLLRSSCQRVSITTDTWTSIQKINYMCVTAHFIDDNWTLQKRILNFCPITSHKGEAIGRALEDCLDSWGVLEKLFTVTVDNASSNDLACAYMRSLAPEKGYVSDGKYMHMRCIAHIINLIVWDGLKEHVKCIDKVRYAVKFVRGSPARLHLFREQVDKCKITCKLSLSLDVPTRWNSTYIMLNTALQYKTVFGRLKIPVETQESGGTRITISPPSLEDWDKIEKLVVFLKEFYDLTNRISGSLYVTSNSLFFHISHTCGLLNQWMASKDPAFKKMAKDMKDKYNKYWGNIDKMNMLIYMGVILDPNFKFLGLQLALHGMYEKDDAEVLARKIKQFAYDFFSEYRRIYAPVTPHSEDPDMSTSIPTSGGGSLALMKSISEQVKIKMRGFGGDSSTGFVRTEFDRYLDEQKGEDEPSNILDWWKLNEPRFPVLARMARDVLAMPISTVASESAFSAGGRTLDRFRSSLTPKTVQGLICAQDWIRAEIRKSNVDVEESLEDLEKLEIDTEKLSGEDRLIFVTDPMI